MTYQQWLMLQRNKYPGIRMQPSRPGPYGEPQFAHFGGRPAWMDQKQPPPPETWGGLLTSMGGAEDRLDSMPDTETTTVIKESLDPEIATTKTTTIKGDPDFAGRGAEHDERGMQDWYAHMAQAQARQQQGTAAPSQQEIQAALGGYGNIRRSQFTPPPNLPGTDFFGGEPTAPPGPVPPPQVDVGQGDFPGRTAEFDERGMQDWNAQMAQLRNRQQTGGAAPTQAQVEESLGRYGDFRRQQLTPPPAGRTFGQNDPMAYAPPVSQPPPDSIATGPTDAMIEERFGRETAMIPNSERSIGGQVREPNQLPPQVDPRIVALNEQEPRTDIGYELPRQVTEGVGEGDVLDTRPRGTMGEGGVSQQGIGELPKINANIQKDRDKMRENPNLEQIWGKYAYDPAARKKAYLANLQKIYRKAMLLDAIAALTGGESRSKQYLQMATGRLDAIDKFDEEERVSNIWREVFTNDEGKFDMPASKTEAARRAAQLGASPGTIKDIFGSISEEKKRDQYFRVDPEDSAKWDIKRFDTDPGEDWIRGQPTARSPIIDKSTAQQRNLKYLQELRKTDPELAKSFARAARFSERDDSISPSKWASFIAADIAAERIKIPDGMSSVQFIQDFLSSDVVEYTDWDGNPQTMPGYKKWSGKQATKDEVESAVKESGEEKEGEEGETVKGTFANEAEAEGALSAGRIKKGDLIIIGKRKARV